MFKKTRTIKFHLCVYCKIPVLDNKYIINSIGEKMYYHEKCIKDPLELALSENKPDPDDEITITIYDDENELLEVKPKTLTYQYTPNYSIS